VVERGELGHGEQSSLVGVPHASACGEDYGVMKI
jgi:hypothetical protein